MSPESIHCLILALIGFVDLCAGYIQYRSLGGDGLKFCMNVPALISYMGESTSSIARSDIDASSITWQITPPNYCTCDGSRTCTVPSLDTTLVCSRPQVFTIAFQAQKNATSVSDILRLEFKYCQELYGWYAVPVSGNPVRKDFDWNQDHLAIRTWITSQGAMSSGEQAGTAVGPSGDSVRLTRTFQEMGLSPYLKTNFPDQRDVYFSCSNQSLRVYDEVNGYWTFRCARNGNDRYGAFGKGGNLPTSERTYQLKATVKVSGRYDFLGYGVSDSSVTFSRPKFKLSNSTPTTVFSHRFAVPAVRYETCQTNSAVVFLPSNKIYITDDEFVTLRPLAIKLDGMDSANILDIEISKSFILILVEHQGMFAVSRTSGVTAKNVYNATLLTGIRSSSWCVSGSQDDSRDTVVTWNRDNVFVGLPENLKPISVPNFINRSTSEIVDVVFDPVPGKQNIVVLVKNINGFILYSVKNSLGSTSVWYQMSDPVITFSTGLAQLFPLLGGNLTVIAALPKAVFQVSETNREEFTVNGASVPMDPVQMALLAETGDLYFLTSTNKIYYGTASTTDVVQFKKPVLPNSILWTDKFHRPALVTFGDGTVTKQFFDVHTELLNADYTVECPFTIFAVSGLEEWYQLDSLDEYRITGHLWFDSSRSGAENQDLEVTIRNASLNGYGPISRVVSQRESDGSLVKITKEVRVTNGAFRSAWLKSAVKGFVSKDPISIAIRPKVLAASCTQRTQVVSFVQTACPTGLSIRMTQQFPCSKNHSDTPGHPTDCPYYGDPYKPLFGLYYFDVFVENVTVDFYIRETSGRTDFSYSGNEIDAGCVRQAQTAANWNLTLYVPPDTAWGPRTYQPCYFTGENDVVPAKTRNYEILNSTSHNAVIFPSDHTAVYEFVATVLANNYSFCDLQATFVVIPEGHGDIPDPMIPVYMFIASCFACALFFLVLYTIYAVSWNENRVGFEMFGKETVPQAWHLLPESGSSLLFVEPQPEFRERLLDQKPKTE